MSDRTARLAKLLNDMPLSWARRWCVPSELGCGCLGCANNSGGLLREGFTKEEWTEYMLSISFETDGEQK